MALVKMLNALLEKSSHFDKDERYMATNDLCSALQKDLKIDENLERRICASILKQLDDPSNDVQSVAVKCLGILLKKVQLPQVLDIRFVLTYTFNRCRCSHAPFPVIEFHTSGN